MRSPQCQAFEKRKLASYFRDSIPGRNQAPGQVQTADACKRVNLQPNKVRSRKHVLGHILPISAGGPAEATLPPSRLTSRSFSTRESLFLILSRFTASTSMAPLDEPRTTNSCP